MSISTMVRCSTCQCPSERLTVHPGSYGSLPLPVVWAASQLAYEIESCPDIFHRLLYQEKLDKSRYAAFFYACVSVLTSFHMLESSWPSSSMRRQTRSSSWATPLLPSTQS